MSDTEYDVIVAGYGPVGETCANLLGYYGIKALILDKEKETFPLPRAITWDAECQRAMAHCNFLTEVKTRKIRGVDNKDAKKRSILKITMDGFDTYNYQHSILFIHQPQFDQAHRENAKKYQTNTIKTGNEILSVDQSDGVVNCSYKNIETGEEFKTNSKYLLACDGANSAIRESAGLRSTSMAANQEAIVARINLNRLHHNFAVQRFLPDGPLALMPIRTQEAALVWSLSKTKSANIFNLSEGEFKRKIINALGDSFKKITLCSEKKIWGLKPSVTRSMGRPGLILAGDSNHSIHPLAGMGFNLALADVAVICDCLSSAKKNGLSFSHPSILSEYRARRRLEVEAIIALTQGLNRLFSYNSFKFKTFPSSFTNIGLGIMDSLPIKKHLAKIAAGGVLTSASLFSDV